MSMERDELAKVIVAAYGEDAEAACPCVQDLEVADAIIAAGYRKPRIITTTDEVDALSDGAVVMTQYGDANTIRDSVRRHDPSAFHYLVNHGEDDYATVLWEPQP